VLSSVELLTPAQFHFATSLGGIDFRPEMLGAAYNNVTGQLSYTVNGLRTAGRYVDQLDANGAPVIQTYSDGSTGVARAGAIEQVRHVAANDNDARFERPFRFDGSEMAG
jgi:hypothetical protein